MRRQPLFQAGVNAARSLGCFDRSSPVGVGLWISGLAPHCCGAGRRLAPSKSTLARFIRRWSIASAQAQQEPVRQFSGVLQEASRHFAIIARPATAMTEAETTEIEGICIRLRLTCGFQLRRSSATASLLHHPNGVRLDRNAGLG